MLLRLNAPAIPNALLKERNLLCQSRAVVFKANREGAHCKYTEEAHTWLINRHLLGDFRLCDKGFTVLQCPHMPLFPHSAPTSFTLQLTCQTWQLTDGSWDTENGVFAADISALATEASSIYSQLVGKASYRRSSCPFCWFNIAWTVSRAGVDFVSFTPQLNHSFPKRLNTEHALYFMQLLLRWLQSFPSKAAPCYLRLLWTGPDVYIPT